MKSLRSGKRYRLERVRRLAVALVCAWGLLDGVTSAIAAATVATHTVVIEGTRFDPLTLTVKRGESVVWVNKDPFPHTVTAKGAFDSHEIAPDMSWRLLTRKVGVYTYICTLHPNMKGTLVVD